MLSNYWKESSKSVKRFCLALKGFIGTVAVSTYITGDPKLAFWFLLAGAALDFVLQLLPPETKIESPGEKVLVLAVFTAFIFGGCQVVKPRTTHTIKDSTTINYVTVDVPVKGAKVQSGVNVDSLFKAWKSAQASGKPEAAKPVTVTDPQTKAELKYWVDQYGNLQASCESKDQTVKALIAQVSKLTSEILKKTEVVFVTPAWNWAAMGALLALLVASVVFNLLKK